MNIRCPTGPKQINVFAYGSNMCTQRMYSRVPSARPVTIGYVSQRRLMFHKRSIDGSAKADALFTARARDRVWGVVYRLPEAEKSVLDRHEFLGVGYDEERVDVFVEGGAIQAWMYVARREVVDPALLPYSWYHDYIVQGAHQHRLPFHYIDYLREFASCTDPDPTRHARNRAVIDSM